LNPQDQRETYLNVVNAKSMDIHRPKLIAPDVSSVLAVISPNNVQEKKSQKMSNAFCVMVITQPATKDAPSTKTYKREPSHPYEAKRP